MKSQQRPSGRSRISTALTGRVDRYLLTCSAVLGAAIATAPKAHADIIYSGPINLPINLNDNGGLFIDLDTGAFSTGTFLTGYDLNFFEATGTQLLQLRMPQNGVDGGLGFRVAPYNYISNLPAGRTVKAGAGTFIPYGILAAGQPSPNNSQWLGASGRFIGFQFQNLAGATNYGWVRLNVSGNLQSGFDGTVVAKVVDYAYENTGQQILTGQMPVAVPEPSSLALGCLAAGAFGIQQWRRSRKNASVK